MSEKTEVPLDLDAVERAAKAAMADAPGTRSTEFLVKTNEECMVWMQSFYQANSIPTIERHCTWSWQEQERRHAPVLLEMIRRLRAAEALATAKIEVIPTDTRVLAIFADIKPEHRADAEEFSRLIQRRTSSWTLVAYFNTDASIEALSVEAMAEAGWVRAPKEDV